MFSRRTGVLLINAILWTGALAWIVHHRQARCRQTTHFARRAPIAGASGRDTFVCAAMYEGMPLGDKLVVLLWLMSALAVLRSGLIDREARRHPQLLDREL